MIFILGIFVIVFILIVLALKFGKRAILSFSTKIVSPACILLFYLSNVSIILPVLSWLNVSNAAIVNTASMRVAIDSAIVTLFMNIVLEFFNTPLNVTVLCRTPNDIEPIIVYSKKARSIQYVVQVDFTKKWIKGLYKRFGGVYLRINNSKYTSIAVDKEDEYKGIMNTNNASKFIEINLCEISNSSQVCDKMFFTLSVLSDRTIAWEDILECGLHIENKAINIGTSLLWELQQTKIKMVHREENNDKLFNVDF